MSALIQRTPHASRAVARRFLPGLLLLAMAGDGLAALGAAPFAQTPGALGAALGPKPRLLAPSAGLKAPYTVHEVQLETGTLVREYANASGQVFAVVWRGPVLPDLSQWLGGYFGAFMKEADQQRLAGRRGAPINLVQEGLVVRSNGRMRNFFGHAYVPFLVPPMVNINEVIQDGPQ